MRTAKYKTICAMSSIYVIPVGMYDSIETTLKKIEEASVGDIIELNPLEVSNLKEMLTSEDIIRIR